MSSERSVKDLSGLYNLRLRKDRAVHPTPTENLRDLLCIARSR